MSEEVFKIIFEEFKKNGVKLIDHSKKVDTFVADPLERAKDPSLFMDGIPPLLDFSEHDKVFEDEIAKLEKRIHELDTIDSMRIDETRKLKQRIAELESEKAEKPTKINLNDRVKVKLTPLGAEIYYHQYDDLNKSIKVNGGTQLEPRMPQIDKDGYTEFTLHHFINLYGAHIGMCKPNVIEPINIELCEDDWKTCYDKEPIEKMEVNHGKSEN